MSNCHVAPVGHEHKGWGFISTNRDTHTHTHNLGKCANVQLRKLFLEVIKQSEVGVRSAHQPGGRGSVGQDHPLTQFPAALALQRAEAW